MNEGMFNDIPAQKYNWLMGVKQMVFTYKKKLKSNMYILKIHKVISVKSCARIIYH